MNARSRILLATTLLGLVGTIGCSTADIEPQETDPVEKSTSAITKRTTIYDAYNGTVNAATQDDLIPYKVGSGPGQSAMGTPSTGCNVYYAYESASAYPADGHSVPANVGYAYMTGNLDDCNNLCAGWKTSYTSSTKFTHRQLYHYPNYHMVLNGDDWGRGYFYDMECMVLDHHQDCTPVFYKDWGSDPYGETYCAND